MGKYVVDEEMPKLIDIGLCLWCNTLIVKLPQLLIKGIGVVAEQYGADGGRVWGNAGGQFGLVTKGQLFLSEAVMFGTGAVVVLWFAVNVGNTSADDSELDAQTCQIGVYLS